MEKLKAFHQELEETVPHLDEVRSLVNVTSMRGEEGELIIEELMEDWPETEEEIAQLRKQVLDNKFYRNFLVSEDGLYTAVMIRSNAFSGSMGGEGLEEMLKGGFEDDDEQADPFEIAISDIEFIIDRYQITKRIHYCSRWGA